MRKNAENFPKIHMSNTKSLFIQNHEKRMCWRMCWRCIPNEVTQVVYPGHEESWNTKDVPDNVMSPSDQLSKSLIGDATSRFSWFWINKRFVLDMWIFGKIPACFRLVRPEKWPKIILFYFLSRNILILNFIQKLSRIACILASKYVYFNPT